MQNNQKLLQQLAYVGASSMNKGQDLPAPFSNYGKQNVDVFRSGSGSLGIGTRQ